MKLTIALVLLIAASCMAANGQRADEKVAGQLQQFEVDWLAADLNNDHDWQRRFYDGKLKFQPERPDAARERAEATAKILDPSLSSNEMKVRISGTITLLTSDPAKNRTFRFLDTFNKKDGKWVVIATSVSPAQGTGRTQPTREEIEEVLLLLNNAAGRTAAAGIVTGPQ